MHHRTRSLAALAVAALPMTVAPGVAHASKANFIGALHISNAVINEDVVIDFTSQSAPFEAYTSTAANSWQGNNIFAQHNFNPGAKSITADGRVEFETVRGSVGPYLQGSTIFIVAFEIFEPTLVRVQGTIFGGQFEMDGDGPLGEIVSGTVAGFVIEDQKKIDPDNPLASLVYAALNPLEGGERTINETILLGPGVYQGGFFAQGTTPLGGDTAWFNGSFIIPAPGASVAMLLGMGCFARRRR